MTNEKEKPYSFWPSEAKKYGIEKAVILYNLRHWLSVNQAAGKDMHCHDGYWWTYNTARAFEKLMPFFNRRSISRWMNELEESGFIKSGVFNASGYDRTKWYTIPSEFSDGTIGQNDQSNCQDDQSNCQDDSPIPVVNPVEKPAVNLSGTSADAPCGVCSGEGLIIGVSRLEDCHHCNGTGIETTCNDGLQVQDVRNSRTTENQVDWSKAPDDATHWAIYTSQLFETGEFAKNVGGRWWILYGGSWVLMHAKRDFIPRPNPVVNSELTTEKQKPAYPEEFEWIWKNKPERSGSNGKKSAYNSCKARIKQGATWRELAEGMQRYAAHCKADGKLNTPYVMQMATFFGPDEHYKNQWSAAAPTKSGAPCPTSAPLVPLASEMTEEQREASRARIKAMMKD